MKKWQEILGEGLRVNMINVLMHQNVAPFVSNLIYEES